MFWTCSMLQVPGGGEGGDNYLAVLDRLFSIYAESGSLWIRLATLRELCFPQRNQLPALVVGKGAAGSFGAN